MTKWQQAWQVRRDEYEQERQQQNMIRENNHWIQRVQSWAEKFYGGDDYDWKEAYIQRVRQQ